MSALDKRKNRQWYSDRETVYLVEVRAVEKKTHSYECYVNGVNKLNCKYSFTAVSFMEYIINQMKEQRRNRI